MAEQLKTHLLKSHNEVTWCICNVWREIHCINQLCAFVTSKATGDGTVVNLLLTISAAIDSRKKGIVCSCQHCVVFFVIWCTTRQRAWSVALCFIIDDLTSTGRKSQTSLQADLKYVLMFLLQPKCLQSVGVCHVHVGENSNYCLHVIVYSCRDICYCVDVQAVHWRWRLKLIVMMLWRLRQKLIVMISLNVCMMGSQMPVSLLYSLGYSVHIFLLIWRVH